MNLNIRIVYNCSIYLFIYLLLYDCKSIDLLMIFLTTNLEKCNFNFIKKVQFWQISLD